MKDTLETIAMVGMKGLGITAIILAVTNKSNGLIGSEIAYPLLFGGLALTTYLIGKEIYQTFREAARTFNYNKKSH